MKCQRVREEIKAYIDGELGPVMRWRVSRHLACCADCRLEERTMTDITNNLRAAQETPAPAGLREKVIANIEFKPADARPRSRFSARPALVAGVLVAVVVAAIILPSTLFHPCAREAARRSSGYAPRLNTAKPGMPVRSEASTPAPASPSPSRPLADSSELKKAQEAGGARYPSYTTLVIIRTADLTLEVRNFQKAYDQTVSICRSVGGYLSDSSAEAEETTPTSGSMILRVPVDKFDHTVERLSRLGVVKSRNVSGQDVTGEVVDLESRLRNKRAEERQYLDVMNRAKRISDIVTVSNELYRVRGEIEEAEGRLKYLKSSAAMATINVNLKENEKARPLPKSSINRTLSNAVASLGRTAIGLATLAIWLGVYSPFWALPLGAVVYVRRRAAAAR